MEKYLIAIDLDGTLRHDDNVEYPLRVVNAPLQRANRIK